MNNQHNNAPVASKNCPFVLICSFKVPTTELNPEFTPSVSVVIGHYQTQKQAKQARQAIHHKALIAAWLHYSFDEDSTATANNGGVQ